MSAKCNQKCQSNVLSQTFVAIVMCFVYTHCYPHHSYQYEPKYYNKDEETDYFEPSPDVSSGANMPIVSEQHQPIDPAVGPRARTAGGRQPSVEYEYLGSYEEPERPPSLIDHLFSPLKRLGDKVGRAWHKPKQPANSVATNYQINEQDGRPDSRHRSTDDDDRSYDDNDNRPDYRTEATPDYRPVRQDTRSWRWWRRRSSRRSNDRPDVATNNEGRRRLGGPILRGVLNFFG